MAVVTLQLGQCGNQTGQELFSLLARDANTPPKYSSADTSENVLYKHDSLERYFTCTKGGTYEAKSVLVDMEPKAIAKCREAARKSGTWCYPKSSEYVQKRGSGNNWALGYHGYGKDASPHVIELCRREVEKCDCFSGFIVLMSLAGGTGSGLGTYLTYALKDNFEDAIIANHVVWPYTSGEVVLQNYNSLLTLSHLYQCSDMIMAQQNSQLQEICTKLLAIKNVTMEDMNKVIAEKLASILQPSFKEGLSPVDTLYQLTSSLACHPGFKMVSIKSIPHVSERSMEFTMYLWSGLLKHLRQMLIADSAMEEGINWEVKLPTQIDIDNIFLSKSSPVTDHLRDGFNRSIANLLVLRGKDLFEAQTDAFKKHELYAPIIPSRNTFSEWRQPRCFNQHDKFGTLLSNSQSFVQPLNHVIDKAWKMFGSRAYLHQYNRYGLMDEDFVDSFGALEQVVANYSAI